jgi:hypothetical protein
MINKNKIYKIHIINKDKDIKNKYNILNKINNKDKIK